MSATQFAWDCCNCGDFQPPRVGHDSHCWLCGGATHGVGWQRKDALVKTAIASIDPALSRHMVPECVYRGICSELKPCGKN